MLYEVITVIVVFVVVEIVAVAVEAGESLFFGSDHVVDTPVHDGLGEAVLAAVGETTA